MSGASDDAFVYPLTVENLLDEKQWRYTITRKTPKRIYFSINGSLARADERCVNRAEFESTGRGRYKTGGFPGEGTVYTKAGLDAWRIRNAAHVELLRAQEAAYQRKRGELGALLRAPGTPPGSPPDIDECRRQMQRHHPDKGGDAATFRLWHRRYKFLKRSKS